MNEHLLESAVVELLKVVTQYVNGYISSTDLLLTTKGLVEPQAFVSALSARVEKEKMEEEELNTPF